MAEISVDFLLGPDWTSRLIAWYGWGANGFSHAASMLADGRYLDARSDVIDEVPAGVHIRMPDTEKSIKRTRATIKVTQSEYDDWEANMRAKIGTPYAYIDIWAFITDSPVIVNGVWDCSQIALNGLQHIRKLPYPLSVPAHQITPNSLLLMMEAIDAHLTDVSNLYP